MGLHDQEQGNNPDESRKEGPFPADDRGGEREGPSSTQSGNLGPFEEIGAAPIGCGSRELLKEQISTLVAEQFARLSSLNYESVQQHFVAVLFANVSSSHFNQNLELAGTPGSDVAHGGSHTAQLAGLIRCCAGSMRCSQDYGTDAEVYSFLGDQIVFLKGMFQPTDLERALALSAMSVPRRVHSLTQLAQMAYHRAGKLLKKGGEGEHAYQKSEFFSYLSNNVQDCIRGLQRVRMEMNFQAYGLHQPRPQSLLGLE